jgi:hypothetical protein
VLESRLLKKTFGPEQEVTRDGGTLHKEEPHDLYSLGNAIRVIKSTRKRWAGRVTRGGEQKCIHAFGWKAEKKTTWRTYEKKGG